MSHGAPRKASFAWGAELVCLSAQDPDASLLGEGVDHLHITEAARLKEIVFKQYLLPVTVDHHASVCMDSTPLGNNWFKKLFDKGTQKIEGIESWKTPSWGNTVSFPLGEQDPGIQRMRSEMSTLTFAQEVEASFVQFEGRIIPEFDRTTHGYSGKDPFIPKEVYAGFDAGYNHPAAIVVGGIDNAGRAIVLDEWVSTDTRPNEIIKIAKQLQHKWKIQQFYCSPERPEVIAEFNIQDVPATKANNERMMGINTLSVLMKIERNEYFPQKSQHHFFISMDRCPSTIEALENAHFKKHKDIISDDFDDFCLDPVDATRYLFHSLKKQYNPETIGNLDWIVNNG